MPSYREQVARYRETIARDPGLYEGELDVVLWLVTDTPERSWTPSEVSRAAGVPTRQAWRHLHQLADEGHIRSDSRGAWTRYWSRRR